MKTLLTIPFTAFSIFFAAAQAPVNDDCTGIINLGVVPYCSQPAQFTNLNATASNIDPVSNVPACWNNPGDRDVWFEFSLPADGSITDITVRVWGNVAGNGTLNMPQLAVYRGDCEFGGLAELDCIAAPLNVNELSLNLFGLTPGVPYFLRINDYSATAMPNWGSFRLCVEAYVPDIILGQSPGSSSCIGTLWDSGGPNGDYSNNQDLTFVICPTEFHQCIRLNFVNYDLETSYDLIRVYEGNSTAAPLVRTLTGVGSDVLLQLSSDCVTIRFTSDGSIVEEGFQMTWQCTAEVCDAPPPVLPSNSTCSTALNINGCANAPQMIPLSPGQGEAGFIQQGVNQGCFLGPSLDLNFSFFYFVAQADGKFGFAVQSANPNEASDIDYNVWGPISNISDICDFTRNNQPIRSSWDEGADLTGLADIHPVFGTPVNDDFDCGSPNTPGTDPPFGTADDFTRRIDVLTGEIYVVLLDDFDGSIQMDGIAIDFSGTTDGVLGPVTPPITVTNDTASCNGLPIQLQITGGISYAWYPSTGLSCNTCPNPFASPTQTTSYEVKVVDVCQTLTDTVTIAVAPNVLLRNDTSICGGQSIGLSLSQPQPGVTYSWTPNDGSLDNPNIANPTATPQQTTVYTLTASSGPCTVVKVVTIAVANLDLNISVQDTGICRGQSVPITVSTSPANIPVNWTPLTQLQLSPDGLSALATPNTNISYKVTATVPGCVRSETVSIRVDSLPANLSLSPTDILVCSGTQVLLSSPSYSGAHFPNLQFTWQTTTGQTFPDNQYFFVVSPTQTTTYQRITTNGVCEHTASATINVLEVPQLSITPPSPQLCLGESTNLVVSNVAGLSNLQWSPAVGLSCIVCPNPTATPTETTIYQFTATAANNCTATASVRVEVNTLPQFQFPNTTLCAGDSIQLNLITDTTVAYTWTSSPPGFTSTKAQPTVSPTATTTYFVTMENGCTLQQQLTIPVVPLATLTLTDSATVCAGVAAQLTAQGSYPGSFTWNNGATGQVISVQPNQSTYYTVTYRYPLANPQCELVDSVLVNVQGEVAQVQFPTDTQLCPGEGIDLNAVATPGATYTWSSIPAGFSSNSAIPPTIFPDESARYSVTTTLDDCTVTYFVDVTVFNPQMVVSEDLSVCAGESVTIFADAFLTGTYQWTPGGTNASFTEVINTNRQYALRFEYGEGCVFEDTVNVSVVPSFMLEILLEPDTTRINAGESIMLEAYVPGTNTSNFTFSWLENNSTPSGNTTQIKVTPKTTDSTVTYTVTAVAPSGCVQSTSVVLTIVQPNVKVPTAFTPNGDGANDTFGLALVEGKADIEKMEIYSRWGQKIFSSNEPNARWNGNIGDKPAPSDVYVYVIFWRGGDGGLRAEKGEVTLLR